MVYWSAQHDDLMPCETAQVTWNLEVMSKCFFMSVPSTWLMQQLRTCMMVSDVRAANCSSTCSHLTITYSDVSATWWLSQVRTSLTHVYTSQSHAHTSLTHALKGQQVCKATRFQDTTWLLVCLVLYWWNGQVHEAPDINLTKTYTIRLSYWWAAWQQDSYWEYNMLRLLQALDHATLQAWELPHLAQINQSQAFFRAGHMPQLHPGFTAASSMAVLTGLTWCLLCNLQLTLVTS